MRDNEARQEVRSDNLITPQKEMLFLTLSSYLLLLLEIQSIHVLQDIKCVGTSER